MRATLFRTWALACVTTTLAALAGALLSQPHARTEEPSPLLFEFRLYAPGHDDAAHQLVSEFYGRWLYSGLPAEVRYNATGEPPGLSALNALTAAGEAWNGVTGQYFAFQAPGTTSEQQPFHPDDGCIAEDAIDGMSTVQWSSGWDDSEFLAITCLWGGAYPGTVEQRITEFDIWINGDAPWSTAGDPFAFDLGTVLLHELGHALGLGHDPDPSTAMFATVDFGQQRRTPTGEDMDGARHLYANALRRLIPALSRE